MSVMSCPSIVPLPWKDTSIRVCPAEGVITLVPVIVPDASPIWSPNAMDALFSFPTRFFARRVNSSTGSMRPPPEARGELRRISFSRTSENAVKAKFAEIELGELRRIPLPRTPLNKLPGLRNRLHSSAMDRVLSLIEHYGYLVILFGVMLESTGVPLPGETILLAAGVLVQRGHLDLGDTIAFGILGAVVGDQIGYWVGREGGRPFVLRWGRYLFITPARLGRGEAFFERHGGKAVFLARFFSGLRVFGALVAGISRMRWGSFLIYNALGGAVWATA